MKTIFQTLAGSRLYGTNTSDSDTDYKSVHLPSAKDILIRPKRDKVISTSTGGSDKNTADDVDNESFELQRYLGLVAKMQTVAVELLFAPDARGDGSLGQFDPIWGEVRDNRSRLLNSNKEGYVGYCKGQAVRYSLRGNRLATFRAVVGLLEQYADLNPKVTSLTAELSKIEGVKIFDKREANDSLTKYMSVFGRQTPTTVHVKEALKIYERPVKEAGKRAQAAEQANGADWKALYHAVRIAEQGISLFKYGFFEFPCSNADYLMKIRRGELNMDAVLDHFDERADTLQNIDNTPLAAEADHEWIDGFVEEQYRNIVLAA